MNVKILLGIRTLLGLVFFGSGLAYFFFFKPLELTGAIGTFFQGLLATGYFLPFLKGVETLCGLALLSGFFVPLAVVILAPIVLNILLVHLFIEHNGLILAVVITVLYAAVMCGYCEYFRFLFKPKTLPSCCLSGPKKT